MTETHALFELPPVSCDAFNTAQAGLRKLLGFLAWRNLHLFAACLVWGLAYGLHTLGRDATAATATATAGSRFPRRIIPRARCLILLAVGFAFIKLYASWRGITAWAFALLCGAGRGGKVMGPFTVGRMPQRPEFAAAGAAKGRGEEKEVVVVEAAEKSDARVVEWKTRGRSDCGVWNSLNVAMELWEREVVRIVVGPHLPETISW